VLESLFIALTLIGLFIIGITWNNNTFGIFGLVGAFMLMFLGFGLVADGIDRLVSVDTNTTQMDVNRFTDSTVFNYSVVNASSNQMYEWLSWVYILGGASISVLIGYNTMFAGNSSPRKR
jgi:hypothetical protein